MGSLREIKTRIGSVKSTRKITSAMKMVSSAKLRKAEKLIENMLPYEERLGAILHNFLMTREEGVPLIFTHDRPVNKLLLIGFASNSSLCGAFNANVIKRLKETITQSKQNGVSEIEVYTFGKKVTQGLRKAGIEPDRTFDELAEKPDFSEISALADELSKRFLAGEIDKVEVVYHEFHSKGKQVLANEKYLPVRKVEVKKEKRNNYKELYFIEPDRDTLRYELLPKYLHIHLFRILLDSNASEHAARMLAMQTATDNADDLLGELTLEYNKTRQQAITAELLDILGGTMR